MIYAENEEVLYVHQQDNPDMGVMYLLKGLLNVLQDYTWEQSSDARVLVYTRVLAMLSAASQEEYLYHIDKGTDLINGSQTFSCCYTLASQPTSQLPQKLISFICF